MTSLSPGHTVIAAVDFSDHGEQILREALLMARAADQSLHVLHVAAGEPVLAGYDKDDISSFTRSARAGELTDEHRRVRELAEALGELPADQRAVVHLKLWEGLTFERIAELLDLPLNTAASRYRYGLDKMRSRLRPLYDEIR